VTEHDQPEGFPPTGPGARPTGPAEENAPATPAEPQPRDAGGWAPKVDRLTETNVGSPAVNVVGRRLTGPIQGFGKMWRKTYRMDIGPGIAPQDAIATWKEHFAEFWPEGSRFEAPLTGISPGEVALLDVGVGGGVRLSTGVFVLYAERAGGGDGSQEARAGRSTVVQTQVLMRANDPLYELAMSLGGHRKEDEFWVQTMTALAKYLGAPPVTVHTRTVCIDPRRQWGNAGAVWHNSMVRTALQRVSAPLSARARRRQRERGSAPARRS
jgi:hypothetical protein